MSLPERIEAKASGRSFGEYPTCPKLRGENHSTIYQVISTGFQPVNTRKRCFGVTFRCHLGLVMGALLCIAVHFSTEIETFAQGR
jgi:hypothetical protein